MDCFDRGINMPKVLLWHLVKHLPYCCGITQQGAQHHTAIHPPSVGWGRKQKSGRTNGFKNNNNKNN